MSDQLPVRLKRDALSAIECCQQNAELRHLSGEGGCFQRAAYVIRKLLEHVEGIDWQPIDTAPHNELVLLYCPQRGIANKERIELDYASHGRTWAGGSTTSVHPWATHWMRLPKPPVIKPGEVDDE